MIRLILTALYLILFFVISLPCYAVLFILRRFNSVFRPFDAGKGIGKERVYDRSKS